ncbi:hypothetical protein H5410_052044 [Solanum commersonii]|uniref:pectinesterase n=1 Tax=Solanum commersonii TaxID=4109 RepID=A0A9J5WZS8_SOLCO|nr:hypothetical protein H5410_052044 [Solanum commersonii]
MLLESVFVNGDIHANGSDGNNDDRIDAVRGICDDGTGDFKTIAGAILAAPNNSVQPYYIKIKQGTYQEYIQVDEEKMNIVLIREGMSTTIITGNRSFIISNKTYDTATVGVFGSGCEDITFRNDAGPGKYQAVALRVEAGLASIYRCRFDGYQDTLYIKMNNQFFRDCEIYGTIDFICGDRKALFQNCLIKAHISLVMQYNTIIAQKREFEKDATGIVLQNCTIKASRDLEKMDNITTYLGQPWGIFSRTVIMESYIGHLISPRGWIEPENTSIVRRRPYYLEYNNKGPGAVAQKRVKWASLTMDPNIASTFTVRNFINGGIPHYGSEHCINFHC